MSAWSYALHNLPDPSTKQNIASFPTEIKTDKTLMSPEKISQQLRLEENYATNMEKFRSAIYRGGVVFATTPAAISTDEMPIFRTDINSAYPSICAHDTSFEITHKTRDENFMKNTTQRAVLIGNQIGVVSVGSAVVLWTPAPYQNIGAFEFFSEFRPKMSDSDVYQKMLQFFRICSGSEYLVEFVIDKKYLYMNFPIQSLSQMSENPDFYKGFGLKSGLVWAFYTEGVIFQIIGFCSLQKVSETHTLRIFQKLLYQARVGGNYPHLGPVLKFALNGGVGFYGTNTSVSKMSTTVISEHGTASKFLSLTDSISMSPSRASTNFLLIASVTMQNRMYMMIFRDHIEKLGGFAISGDTDSVTFKITPLGYQTLLTRDFMTGTGGGKKLGVWGHERTLPANAFHLNFSMKAWATMFLSKTDSTDCLQLESIDSPRIKGFSRKTTDLFDLIKPLVGNLIVPNSFSRVINTRDRTMGRPDAGGRIYGSFAAVYTTIRKKALSQDRIGVTTFPHLQLLPGRRSEIANYVISWSNFDGNILQTNLAEPLKDLHIIANMIKNHDVIFLEGVRKAVIFKKDEN